MAHDPTYTMRIPLASTAGATAELPQEAAQLVCPDVVKLAIAPGSRQGAGLARAPAVHIDGHALVEVEHERVHGLDVLVVCATAKPGEPRRQLP